MSLSRNGPVGVVKCEPSSFPPCVHCRNASTQVQELSVPGEEYLATGSQASWLYQTGVLTYRNLIVNVRDIGVFWLRLGMCESVAALRIRPAVALHAG